MSIQEAPDQLPNGRRVERFGDKGADPRALEAPRSFTQGLVVHVSAENRGAQGFIAGFNTQVDTCAARGGEEVDPFL